MQAIASLGLREIPKITHSPWFFAYTAIGYFLILKLVCSYERKIAELHLEVARFVQGGKV